MTDRQARIQDLRDLASSDVHGMAHNILTMWKRAKKAEKLEGTSWYRDAHEYARSLSEDFAVSTLTAAHVISALSPSNRWAQNKADALTVFKAVEGDVGPEETTVSTYHGQKSKAFAIAETQDHSLQGDGRKTNDFAECIAFPGETDAVVVDRHALAVALGVGADTALAKEVHLTDLRYRNVAEAYRLATEWVNRDEAFRHLIEQTAVYKPHHVQATVWVAYRNRYVGR